MKQDGIEPCRSNTGGVHLNGHAELMQRGHSLRGMRKRKW